MMFAEKEGQAPLDEASPFLHTFADFGATFKPAPSDESTALQGEIEAQRPDKRASSSKPEGKQKQLESVKQA